MSTEIDVALRAAYLEEVRKRLIGPLAPQEELREKPQKRYLTGMLFPRGSEAVAMTSDEPDLPEDAGSEGMTGNEGTPDSPTDLLFQKLPASVGLTFALADEEKELLINLSAARYELRHASAIANPVESTPDTTAAYSSTPEVWRRCSFGDEKAGEVILFDPRTSTHQCKEVFDGYARLHLHVRESRGLNIATLSLVNEKVGIQDVPVETADILFQVGLSCRPSRGVPAYPETPSLGMEDEAAELALQYQAMPAFAVGHGAGAVWPDLSNGRVEYVAVDYLPTAEVPPVTTELDFLPESVSEALSLVRLQKADFDPLPAFRTLVGLYREWYLKLEHLPIQDNLEKPKARILSRIATMGKRIEDGIELLSNEPQAREVFRLANKAMLLSMARTSSIKKRALIDDFVDIDLEALPSEAAKWRPFQIAFILLSLRGLWNPNHPDRDLVDLIWFPTGGGKTEAYLAVAAFEMIRRRLIDGDRGKGTAIIKRYTLRLLTIQQFERASGLICALESLRRSGELDTPEAFSLGLWVGKDSSPNTFHEASLDYQKIVNTAGLVAGVRVPLKSCPVCGTELVPLTKEPGTHGVGLRDMGNGGIELFCPRESCSFHDTLPISFIDEYLYQAPPTMLLGTIDKFAMLAWRDEARSFFGTGEDRDPPSLIIQDELHLISGPLGTLASIYEAAIDTAIRMNGKPAKYICATATIRRANDQILKLYGRSSAIFPPPGLDAADSFFSRVSRGRPGRLYIGAMGQGHTPTFSNVIVSTALLAATDIIRERAGVRADTWWTLVAYHNSKRELGKTLSLARDDIPKRLEALGERRRLGGGGVRELSANLKDSELPEVLKHLNVELPNTHVLDYVACTNMLSVGIDIQRLGLMLVNGQPKSVSEYIQATSRIGRSLIRPPGVVCTLFSPTKPRDRSHYEYFLPFHKGYYRHVEPTSVTPNALPAIERGLHGAFIALVRMVSGIYRNNSASKILSHSEEIDRLAEAILARLASAEDGAIVETAQILTAFLADWKRLAREKKNNLRFQSDGKAHAALMKPFKSPIHPEARETLQSLRFVDEQVRLIPPQVQTGTRMALGGNKNAQASTIRGQA